MNYITYSDLIAFVLMIIALLTYLDNRNHKHKKTAPVLRYTDSND